MIERQKMTAVLLRGGQAKRMGYIPKETLLYQGITFQDKLLQELTGFAEIAISDRHPGGPGVWADIHKGCGPIGGIHTALSRTSYEWVFVTACDTPLLSKDCINYIIGHITANLDCVVPIVKDTVHPLCAAYCKNILPQLEVLISAEDYRIRSLLSCIRTRYIEMPEQYADCFYNVNTPELFRKL